jgi:predicted nucleic acid-binding protein
MSATGSALVDTSVVVNYLRQDPSLHEKMDQIEDVYLALPALGELLYGAHKSKLTKGKGSCLNTRVFSRLHSHSAR